MRTSFVVIALLAIGLVPASTAQISSVQEFLPGVRFSKPVAVESAPGQSDRVYVVEQGDVFAQPVLSARILTVEVGGEAPAVFLDLSGRVGAIGGETGLLGLAFHPDYETNGLIYVHYTALPEQRIANQRELITRVSEFTRDAANPLAADPNSERILLEVDQPRTNHNGGDIDFGPDGFLYIALGDGGGAGDPFDNGLDATTLLGAVLRIDVDGRDVNGAYSIPADNPFAATDGPERDEIFAYGLRNPYKIDADQTGVWAADVGQNRWEEVNLVESGGNYGWNQVEGPECYQSGCDLNAFEAPVASYRHSDNGGRASITGGYVTPEDNLALPNHYIYGDFLSGRIWALDIATMDEQVILEPGGLGLPALNISSIDPHPSEPAILVTNYDPGIVYSLNRVSTSEEGVPEVSPLAVTLAGPNPFRQQTSIRVESPGPVRVTVVDLLGREVAQLWDGPAPPSPLVLDAPLAPGVYTVRAEGVGGSTSVRVVKAR